MTRWARSKSSQRHEKLPLDPTPWAEFALKNNFERNKNVLHRSNPNAHILDDNVKNTNNDLKKESIIKKHKNKQKSKKSKNPPKINDSSVVQMRSMNQNTKYNVNIENPIFPNNSNFPHECKYDIPVKSFQCVALNEESNTKQPRNKVVESVCVTFKNVKKRKKKMLTSTGKDYEQLHVTQERTMSHNKKSKTNKWESHNSNSNDFSYKNENSIMVKNDHITLFDTKNDTKESRNNSTDSDHVTSKKLKKKKRKLINTESDSEDLTPMKTMGHNSKSQENMKFPLPSNNNTEFSYKNKIAMLSRKNQCISINESNISETKNIPVKNDHGTLKNSKKLKKKRKCMSQIIESDSKDIPPRKHKVLRKGKKIVGENINTMNNKEILSEAKSESDEIQTLQSSGNESDSCDMIKESSRGKVKEKHIDGKKRFSGQTKNKLRWLNKVKENRKQNGIFLLPTKVEQKLYRVRKQLREKGLPGELIKEIMRKRRRREELQYRKSLSNQKTCFKCRQTGHLFADCPVVVADNEQGTGICFKCGSTEHVSRQCPIKTKDFPFAKCFICQQQGHLSRNCPENKHGVYPKGGKCNLCGAVDHLKKECPTLEKSCELSITAHVMSGMTSADAEILNSEIKKKMPKGPKVVKF